jgi:hypothetical protein
VNRRTIRGVVPVLAFVASCGGGGETAQSTTSAPPPATTAATTTVTPTTSAAPTTTTTVAPTTTTTPPVTASALTATATGTLGWFDPEAGEWVAAPTPDDLPAVTGETFEVVTLEGVSQAEAVGVDVCEITGNALIEFDPALPGEPRVSGSIAVLGAAWALVPRPVVAGEPPPDRLQEALDHLATQGIEESDPPFAQYVEADLGGGAELEGVLTVARGERLAGPGDYSLVMLFAAGGSSVVAESYGDNTSPYVLHHVIAAVADLDGTGTMEVVLDTSYYEGSGSVAYEYVDGRLVDVLGGGCGA